MRILSLTFVFFVSIASAFAGCPLITTLSTTTPDEQTGVFAITIGSSEAGRIRVIWDGGQDHYEGFSNPLVVYRSTRCLTGPHTLEVHAERDYSDCDPDIKTTTVVPPGPGNQINGISWNSELEQIEIGYAFPNTEGGTFRHIDVYLDGHTSPDAGMDMFLGGGTGSLMESGTAIVQKQCWANGAHHVKVVASSCSGAPTTTETDVNVTRTQSVSAHVTEYPNGWKTLFIDSYQFSSSQGGRSVVVEWMPSATASGTNGIATIGDLSQQGTYPSGIALGYPPYPSELLRVTALTCSSSRTSTYLHVSDNGCPSCPGWSGNPVRTATGNMRYVDTEPLPFAIAPITRTYDSQSDRIASFGRGWSSVFDGKIRTFDGADNRDTAMLITPDNDRLVFERNGGTYRQAVPPDNAPGTLTTAADGTLAYQPARGSIVQIYDPATARFIGYRDLATGRTATVVYDANGLPIRIDDSWGNSSLIITNNGSGHVATIGVANRSDIVWQYNYGANDTLTSITAPDSGTWRSYQYDSNSYLNAVRDAPGNVIESHQFDARGRATTDIGPAGDYSSIQLNTFTTRVSGDRETYSSFMTTAGKEVRYYQRFIAGRQRTVEISGGCTSCGVNDAVFAYDASGNIVREQDARGYITLSVYDTNGRRTSTTRGLVVQGCDPATDSSLCRQTPDTLATATLISTATATTTSYTYDDPYWPARPNTISTRSVLVQDQRVQRITYDASSGTVVRSEVTGWTGQPAQQETHVTITTLYDGIQTAAFNPCGGTTCGFASSWLLLPQPQGFVKTFDGPRSDVADVVDSVYYPIDSSVLVGWRGRLAARRDASGRITRYENYDVFGNATRIIAADGVVSEGGIDTFGRPTANTLKAVAGCDTTADPLCSTDVQSTTGYAAGGGPVSHRTSAGGGRTDYVYDPRSRVQSITRSINGTASERLEYDYDPYSLQKSAERYRTNASGTYVTKRSEWFAYDIDGRLSQLLHADGTKILQTYDSAGNLRTVQDENHSAPNTTYKYDPLGRLQTVRQTLAGASGGTITTAYGYDLQGNLVSVTDPNSNQTIYLYDDFGRMILQTSPVSGITSYTYDAAGNLIATTDANGATATRAYDATGRVQSAVSTKSGSSETATWSYEPSTGRLSAMTDPTGGTTYAYDRRGLILVEQKTIDGVSYTTRFTYDADGNRGTMTYPSGRVVAFTYDRANRPLTAATGSLNIVTGASYEPFGPLSTLSFGNGTTNVRTFDSRDRISDNKLTGATGTIAEYGYEYDNVGNITSLSDIVDPSYSRTLGYDDLNRLVTANSGAALWGTGSYAYDAMGNVLSSTLGNVSRTFAYATPTPRLTAVTENGATGSVSYDASGNETSASGAAAAYSARNHLQNTAGFSYGYDARGIRTITSANATASIASLIVSPSSILGGNNTTGTVTINGPAPAGGAVIVLESGNHGIALPPDSALVNAGSTSATFNITTRTQLNPSNTQIRATYLASAASAALTVEAPVRVSDLSISPSNVSGGTSATATVTLNQVAPAGGTTVTLNSSSPSTASVPGSVTVPAGATTTTFSVTTVAVATSTSATISAMLLESHSVVLTISSSAVEVASVSLAPTTVYGGAGTATGTVALTLPAPAGDAVVMVASSNTSIATVPASVTIAAGSTSSSFTVGSSSIATAQTVTISATYGTTRSANLTVASCSSWTGTQATIGDETVWFDDSLPPGATPVYTWIWDTDQKTSGFKSHTDPAAAGAHSHYMTGSSLSLAANDQIIVYVLVDPCNPPDEIMFQFLDSSGSWDHRVYWGTEHYHQAYGVGTEGTGSMRRMGNIPAGGQWIRLAIPAYKANLAGSTLTGISFNLWDGKVWFDRVGKASCTASAAPAPSSFPSTDSVWFDDDVPSGTTTYNWQWDTSQSASGTRSHTDAAISDLHGHYFTGASRSLGTTDTFVVYALVDRCAVPDEIMMQWNEPSAGWAHRAFWGTELFQVGTVGTNTMRRIGDVPAPGQWVRLEIPVTAIGMDGATVTGFYMGAANGRVWFDRVSVAPGGSGALNAAPTIQMATALDSTQRGRLASLQDAWRRMFAGSAPPLSLSVTSRLVDGRTQIASTTGLLERHSLYSPELHLVAETNLDATPSIAYEYVWFAGQPIAQIETASNTVHYYFNDHLGAPLLTTSSTGTIDWRAEREPFGKTFATRAGFDRRQPLSFPGQEDDATSDRSYNIFRWYRAGWGRYTQSDPIGLRAGTNLYTYGLDRPSNVTDEWGLSPEICCQLRDQIRTTRNRLWDLLKDELNDTAVFRNAPNIASLTTNYIGHRIKFYNERRRLGKLFKRWTDNDCDDKDLPPGSPDLLSKEYPDFDTRRLRPYFERQRDILGDVFGDPLDLVRMFEFGTMGEGLYAY